MRRSAPDPVDLPAGSFPLLDRALPAWRADEETIDLAPAVLSALRAERVERAPSEAPRRWAHVGWAALTAAALAGVGLLPWSGEAAGPSVVARGTESTQPRVAGVGALAEDTTAEAAAAPAHSGAAAEGQFEGPRLFPADRLTLREELLPEDLFTAERLADAWAALPDPDRTWRDEVRDGVRPFRDGARTVATLFAEALPPARPLDR